MTEITDNTIFIFGIIIYAIFIGATFLEFKKAGNKLDKKSN